MKYLKTRRKRKKQGKKEILSPRFVYTKLWKVIQTTYIKTTSLQISCVSSHGEVRLQTLPHTCASHKFVFFFLFVLLPFSKGRGLQAWDEMGQGLQHGADSGCGSS